jgi:hypothetical protein
VPIHNTRIMVVYCIIVELVVGTLYRYALQTKKKKMFVVCMENQSILYLHLYNTIYRVWCVYWLYRKMIQRAFSPFNFDNLAIFINLLY